MLINRVNGSALMPLQALSRELDRMFDGFVEGTRGNTRSTPPVTIWEDADAFHLQALVPGVASEDLDISVSGNQISLKGKLTLPEPEGATLHRREWQGYAFERTFELPTDVDNQAIEAKLEQGVLHLTLPKAPQHKPVKVQIRTTQA